MGVWVVPEDGWLVKSPTLSAILKTMIVILGLLVMLAWGVGNYIAARAGKSYDAYLANLVFQTGGLVLSAVVLLFTGVETPFLSSEGVKILALGSLFSIAFIGYIAAMQKAQVGAVAALANAYLFVTTAILIITGYNPTIYELIGMCGIAVGAGFINYSRENGKHILLDKNLLLTAVPIIAWGVAFYLIDGVAQQVPWHDLAFGTNLSVMVWSLLFWFLFSKKQPKLQQKLLISSVGGATTATGSVLLYVATEQNGSVVIPVVIAAGSPLVVALLAAKFEREKMSRLKWAGAVLIVAAIALTNL